MIYKKESVIEAAPERVFAFHELPDAFERLMPPWEMAKIIKKADISKIGSEAIVEVKLFGLLPVRWVSVHTAFDPPHLFEDQQASGPFRSWCHRHIVTPHESGARLTDEVDFEPPFGILGSPFVPFLVLPKLEKMFEYRHRVTTEWCEKGE